MTICYYKETLCFKDKYYDVVNFAGDGGVGEASTAINTQNYRKITLDSTSRIFGTMATIMLIVVIKIICEQLSDYPWIPAFFNNEDIRQQSMLPIKDYSEIGLHNNLSFKNKRSIALNIYSMRNIEQKMTVINYQDINKHSLINNKIK